MVALEEFQTDGLCNNWVVGSDPFKSVKLNQVIQLLEPVRGED